MRLGQQRVWWGRPRIKSRQIHFVDSPVNDTEGGQNQVRLIYETNDILRSSHTLPI